MRLPTTLGLTFLGLALLVAGGAGLSGGAAVPLALALGGSACLGAGLVGSAGERRVRIC